MENLWEHMESVCSARLARHFGILPPDDRDRPRAGRTVFALRWVAEAPRLRVRERPETPDEDPPSAGREIAHLIARGDQMEADEQPAATRAVLESRIVGLALQSRADEGKRPDPSLLERLPFPDPEPAFARQLAILAHRASEEAGVDWAVERVVAELYDVPLEQLVDIQARLRPER